MRLYSGMSRNFIDDTVRNQIAGKLEDAFFRIELKQWDKCSPATGERSQFAEITSTAPVLTVAF